MNITRMNKGEWGKTIAFFDVITKEGFTIKGFRLVQGDNGIFVRFPSQQDKEGEYRNTVWAEKEVSESLLKLAKTHYDEDKPLAVQQNPEDIPF